MMPACEVNFDGLVGPTHNYAGLSFGNIASEANRGDVSRPKQAALQGLAKMKFLHDLGLKQAVLPPLCRPYLPLLTQLGFSGSPRDMLAQCAHDAPQLLPQIYSASSMWTANAATVSPSADTADGKVHFTAANLVTYLHRSLESTDTASLLKAIFSHKKYFVHHDPLPAQPAFGDEGAANFMRFAGSHGQPGLEVLVYGEKTRKYPSRQTQLASQSLFRRHSVARAQVIAQDPDVIDQGVFHNDVIAVANENVLLYHEAAFSGGEKTVSQIERKFGQALCRVRIDSGDVSVRDAVSSYLFNSQLVTLPDGTMALIAPQESQDNIRVRTVIQHIMRDRDNPISQVHFLNLRESMKNGGGPACLRLRVVLTEKELAAMHLGVLFTDALHAELAAWVKKHYREALAPADLADPQLMEESFAAQRELLELLQLTRKYKPEVWQ